MDSSNEGGETMHLMPSWYPYIDWDKSDLKIKVLKPDTPQEIKDDFEKYQEELRKRFMFLLINSMVLVINPI